MNGSQPTKFPSSGTPYLGGDGPRIGSPKLTLRLREYLNWDKNPKFRSEIENLFTAEDEVTLGSLLLPRLEFGTAGIRGKMGGGYAQMNDLVIIQTSQGLCSYLMSLFGGREQRSVVIGYDGRHNSRRFAGLTARAMIAKGFKVYLFQRCVPTPFIPFAVTLFKSVCGIMITASHNPKEDNGYKVYWENGAQIVSPHDKKIQDSILRNTEPWDQAWEEESVWLLTDNPIEEVEAKYFEQIKNSVLYPELNSKTSLEFTYTPMHGVGAKFIEQGFTAAGLKLPHHVPDQVEINPNFPTVKFPNPEEGKSALKLAIETANSKNCSIIVANDPDADRLAVAEKVNDVWKIFNGNELGALLGWWSLFVHKEKNGESKDLSDCYMLASTVSSKILRTMAEKEGFNFIETLTGFKWMGNKTVDLMKANKKSEILFAFEEAIGFMIGTAVLDKDGISAGVRLAELAVYLNSKGLTLHDQLKTIYEIYGYHVSENSYYICRDPEIIKSIFDALRSYGGEENAYPTSLMGGKYNVTSVRDLTTGFDSAQPDNKPLLPVSKNSQMITFEFENGLTATLRTSGTEPKVKYYTELRGAPEERDWNKVTETLHEMVEAIISEFFQPTKYGLEARSD